jgi:hypothetical protein
MAAVMRASTIYVTYVTAAKCSQFQSGLLKSRSLLVIEVEFPLCRIINVSDGFIDFLQERCAGRGGCRSWDLVRRAS